MRSVIIDGPDSWSQTLVKEGIAERFIGLDFSDADTVFDRSLDAIKKAQSVRSPSYFALGDLGSALAVCMPFCRSLRRATSGPQ